MTNFIKFVLVNEGCGKVPRDVGVQDRLKMLKLWVFQATAKK